MLDNDMDGKCAGREIYIVFERKSNLQFNTQDENAKTNSLLMCR